MRGRQVDCRDRSCTDYIRESYGFCIPCCNAPFAAAKTIQFPNCKTINVFKDACKHYRAHGRYNIRIPWIKIHPTSICLAFPANFAFFTFSTLLAISSASNSSLVLSLGIDPMKSRVAGMETLTWSFRPMNSRWSKTSLHLVAASSSMKVTNAKPRDYIQKR